MRDADGVSRDSLLEVLLPPSSPTISALALKYHVALPSRCCALSLSRMAIPQSPPPSRAVGRVSRVASARASSLVPALRSSLRLALHRALEAAPCLQQLDVLHDPRRPLARRCPSECPETTEHSGRPLITRALTRACSRPLFHAHRQTRAGHPATRNAPMRARTRLPPHGRWVLGAGCWMRGAGHWLLSRACDPLAAGCGPAAIGARSPARSWRSKCAS